MQKMNVSAKDLGKFAGKWVVIDTTKNKVIAAAKTFDEIAPLVTRGTKDKTPNNQIPAAFKVPKKNELRHYAL